jgi:hypothetical protein
MCAYELDLLWWVECDLCSRARRMGCHVLVVNFSVCNCIPTSIFRFIGSTNKRSFQFQFFKDIGIGYL